MGLFDLACSLLVIIKLISGTASDGGVSLKTLSTLLMSLHFVPTGFAFVSNQDHCPTLSSVLACRPCSPSMSQHALRRTTLTNSSHDLDFVLDEHASSIFLHCCFSCNLNANCNAFSHSVNSPDSAHLDPPNQQRWFLSIQHHIAL